MDRRVPAPLIVLFVVAAALLASCDYSGRYRIYDGGGAGFIDRRGTVVIPAVYEEAEGFSEGRALVVVDGLD